MSPVNYIPLTRAAFPDQPPYQWSFFTEAPWTPLTKPLEDARLALISSGGVFLEGQEPFDPVKNDLSFRKIPRDVTLDKFGISHNFYDHRDASIDPNCVFPLERLRELEKEGLIGSLAPTGYSFMGRCFKRREFIGELAPQILAGLQAEEVDVFLLVPA